MTRNLLFPALACVALAATVAVAPAAEVTLPNTLDFLVDDPTNPDDDADAFINSPSGRFRFSEFVFSPQATDGTPPGETDVRVSMSESANSVSVIFEFLANNTASGPGAHELALEYLAEVSDPNFAFVSHTLSMDGTTEGDGWIFINEEILTSDNQGIGNVATTLNVTNQSDTLSDTLPFAPTRRMTIHNKDISVSGVADGSNATLVRIEQTFQVIPEPSSLALGFLGVLGLGMTWRRFHRT